MYIEGTIVLIVSGQGSPYSVPTRRQAGKQREGQPPNRGYADHNVAGNGLTIDKATANAASSATSLKAISTVVASTDYIA